MKRSGLALAFASLLSITTAHAQEEPFEPGDLGDEAPLDEAPRYRPVTDTLLSLVSLYREDIGPRSIRRCPFAVSCSTLAERELKKNGIVGLLVFLDRFFYRENLAAPHHYPRRRGPEGQLLLDDQEP